jgi:hypothetical protein
MTAKRKRGRKETASAKWWTSLMRGQPGVVFSVKKDIGGA